MSSAPASSTTSSSFLRYGDLAFAMEHPANRAGFRHIAAILAHEVAEFTDDSVAVGGHDLDQHAHAARAVSFKCGFFVHLAFQLAGAPQDGALNVFIGHVLALGRQDGGT
jgi:hypothetical protein